MLNKLLIGGVLSCASIVNAEFFNFPEESTLSKVQQRTLKALFITTATGGIKTLITSFDAEILTHITKNYLKNSDSQSLVDVILHYLLNTDRKEKDLNEILGNQSSIDISLINADNVYKDAIKRENDGLFNGIIRETLSIFKTYILLDTVSDKKQLNEAFNVLWDTISANKAILKLDEDSIQSLTERYPDLKIASLIEKLNNSNGKTICEKIANLLASTIEEKIEETIESHCCGWFQTTFGIVQNAVKTIIPYIPEVLKLTITIITLVK